MSKYEKEFTKGYYKDMPRKAKNYLIREFGGEKILGKWETCHKFRDNILYGTLVSLAGCVAFWNLRCHKLVRQVNENLDIMSPETLNTIAWSSSIIAKIVGVGFYINAINEYKKC